MDLGAAQYGLAALKSNTRGAGGPPSRGCASGCGSTRGDGRWRCLDRTRRTGESGRMGSRLRVGATARSATGRVLAFLKLFARPAPAGCSRSAGWQCCARLIRVRAAFSIRLASARLGGCCRAWSRTGTGLDLVPAIHPHGPRAMRRTYLQPCWPRCCWRFQLRLSQPSDAIRAFAAENLPACLTDASTARCLTSVPTGYPPFGTGRGMPTAINPWYYGNGYGGGGHGRAKPQPRR